MDEMLETLFMDFLESTPAGPLADAMHQLSRTIDQQIAAGDVDPDTIGDYECAAMKYGFAGGFAAAQQLIGGARKSRNRRA